MLVLHSEKLIEMVWDPNLMVEILPFYQPTDSVALLDCVTLAWLPSDLVREAKPEGHAPSK